MSTSETRSARPILYGEFGGPSFDPEYIQAIKDMGDKEILLSDFFSENGVAILKGHEGGVARLLAQHNQKTPFIEGAGRGVAFRAHNVEHVTNALRSCNLERLFLHLKGGAKALTMYRLSPTKPSP